MILRFIFWILIILWIFNKLRNILSDEQPSDKTFYKRNNDYTTNDNIKETSNNKTLKNNAGDYVDYEEIK